MSLPWVESMIGQDYHFLKVLRLVESNDRRVICLCKGCGKIKEMSASNVKYGTSKSCGCKKGEIIRDKKFIHGGSHDGPRKKEFSSWRAMKFRCYNKKHHLYHRYGGRGILVCDRWINGEAGKLGFQCFMDDMGERPEGWTLERVDNAQGYSPANCKWIPRKDQAKNRDKNWKVEIDGQILTGADAARIIGIGTRSIPARLRNMGLDKAKIVTMEDMSHNERFTENKLARSR